MVRIIYDETGHKLAEESGSDLYTPVGIAYIDVEIPQGKYLIGVDVSVTPNVPVFEDLPKTEVQLLHEKVDDLNVAIAALIGGAV